MLTQISSHPSPTFEVPKLPIDQERERELRERFRTKVTETLTPLVEAFVEKRDAYLENRKVIDQQRSEIAQQRSEIAQQLVSAQKKIEDAQQKKLEAQQVKLEAQQKKLEAQQVKLDAGKRLKELADEKVAIDQRKQATTVKEEQLAKDKQRILTQMFYGIFHKKEKCPDTQTIFATYLADKSVTMEKDHLGKNFVKINSMRAVIRYLDDHPTLKGCDFRAFKSEVEDISTLATYLSTSKTITVIAIKMGIPEIEKVYLKDAEKARKGTLKVQYFA